MFPNRLVLGEMEKAGFLERRSSPADWRTHALHLTAKARDKPQALGRIARDPLENGNAALITTSPQALIALLWRIAEDQRFGPGVHPGHGRLDGGPSLIVGTDGAEVRRPSVAPDQSFA